MHCDLFVKRIRSRKIFTIHFFYRCTGACHRLALLKERKNLQPHQIDNFRKVAVQQFLRCPVRQVNIGWKNTCLTALGRDRKRPVSQAYVGRKNDVLRPELGERIANMVVEL